MSHQWFQKPENALKRANELINMPNSDAAILKRQKTSALEILHDTLTSKRNKTWQQTHEDIMILYIDTCIQLQLGRVAKDGLHQYRNLSLQQNPASLEKVMTYFIEQSEKKVSEAHKFSTAASLAIDDLEENESPEALMLGAATSENHRERTEREHMLPWLRFVWEAYRTVLEILRYNSKLQNLYSTVALKAFNFCKLYQRKVELRRLSEILRTHLQAIQKYSTPGPNAQPNRLKGWEGWSAESVELHLELRFEQLECAVELENWTEGFRTIEDISSVFDLTDMMPKVSLLATYYEKLTQIFWVSKNYLFHAYAWLKFFSLSKKHNTNLKQEQISGMASAVVLATLSIPIIDDADEQIFFGLSTTTVEGGAESEIQNEKAMRMATLMGFASLPKRTDLLTTIIEDDILTLVRPEIVQLYHQMEDKFHPLRATAIVKPILEELRQCSSLAQYIPALEKLLIQRLITQLANVYSNVTIDHFKSLMSGLNVTFYEVEKLIVRLVQKGHFQVRIDHREGCLHFGGVSMNSKDMQSQLTVLGQRLHSCMKKLDHFADSKKAHVEEQKALFTFTRRDLEKENARMLNRKVIIEKKKEEIECLQQEKVKNEERRRLELEKQRRELERARLEQEAKKREQEKRQRIKDEINLKETKQMLDRLGHDTENMAVTELEKIDREKVLREANEQAQREREEAQKRLKDQAKRLDYIVRATREAELPILAKSFEEQCCIDLENHKKQEAELLKKNKEEHVHALQEKTRLQRMAEYRSDFNGAFEQRRTDLYESRLAEQMQKLALKNLTSRVERARARKQQEEERLRREEEERIAEEKRIEAERVAAEEAEKKKLREEEEEAERERVAARIQAREKEIEDRMLASANSRAVETDKESSWKRGGDRNMSEGSWTQVSRDRSRARDMPSLDDGPANWREAPREAPRQEPRGDRYVPPSRRMDRDSGDRSSRGFGSRRDFGEGQSMDDRSSRGFDRGMGDRSSRDVGARRDIRDQERDGGRFGRSNLRDSARDSDRRTRDEQNPSRSRGADSESWR